MIDRMGRNIERFLRACVASRFLPRTVKGLCVFLGVFLVKRRFMHSFLPTIKTEYGHTLAGAPADSSLNQIIFFRDVFEPVLSKLVWNLVEEGDVCVDAGANVGYFTLLMAQRAGRTGKVFSIEAAPGNVVRLIQNITLNGLDDRVEVISAACSDDTGMLTFHVNSHSDMLCRLQRPRKNELDYWLTGGTWQSIVVPSDNLSSLVGGKAANVNFLKLDVEGTEHKLCRDIVEHFTNERLCVAIEAKQPHVRDTLGPFERAGFLAYDLHNNYLWVLENTIQPPTRVTFDQLYATKYMADVLLSREELPLMKLY